MFIGDSNNDISMIKFTGIDIAIEFVHLVKLFIFLYNSSL
ncbi:hypothetical protein ACQPUY_02045 [Clostridium nigeriense]